MKRKPLEPDEVAKALDVIDRLIADGMVDEKEKPAYEKVRESLEVALIDLEEME